MSSKEYTKWKAYYSIRPWGEEMQNYRIGMVTQSIRAANSKEPIYMKDCIPVFESAKEKKAFDWKASATLLKERTISMRGKIDNGNN
jgi:hypothetical protein